MNLINIIYILFYDLLADPFIQLAIWAASFIFMIGYTWTTKVDNTTTCQASHVNLLQTEKIDRDGVIPFTGTSQWDKGADIASAATLVPGADGNCYDVTGTTTITAINAVQSQPGTVIKLHFDGILKIVHHATNLILPDGKDIYTMAGTELEFVEYAADDWRCTGYLRGVPVLTNLLGNSGFGVWSQGDASKGLATITYDQGSKGAGTAPSVGDAVVGGTSGTTAKVISYTTVTGDWATNDATGIITVGAVSHDFAFVDNETITFGGVETAVINMPDSAVQVGLVQNGGFATDTDPPPGWTAVTATLTTEAGGQVGNCMQVASSGAALGKAYQDITTVIGKIYKLSLYFKKGTSDTGKFMIGIVADEDSIYDSGDLSDAAWTAYTYTFEATATTTRITMQTTDATITENSLFDEISCYEITPCCTAANDVAFDGWEKLTTCDIYRQHNDGGTYTKDGSFYSLMMVPTADGDWVMWARAIRDKEYHYQKYAGRLVAKGVWAKTSTASHFRISVYDGAHTYSAYHPGDGEWHWIEMPHTVSATTTNVYTIFWADAVPNTDGSTIVYVSQPMFIFGSHIGEGNYRPRQQEVVLHDAYMTSNLFDSLLNQSDIAYTDLNIEADSDARLPKGCKAVLARTILRDSGSAGIAAAYLGLRPDATLDAQYFNSVAGKTNNAYNYMTEWVKCNSDGDIQYRIDATGAGTMDITNLRYLGVQVN